MPSAELGGRDHAIRWPDGFDPSAVQSFAHNELLIDVACGEVFDRLADVTKWPEWLVFAKNVSLVTPGKRVGIDARFRWTIFGLPIESRVADYEPGARMGWFSYSPGAVPLFYHSWHFVPVGPQCRVTTEEVGRGPDAARATAMGDTRTHRAHDLWLASLKWIAEGGTSSR